LLLLLAVCYTEACPYLDRRPPKISLVAVTPVLSIILTLIVNLAAQVGIYFWLHHQPWSVVVDLFCVTCCVHRVCLYLFKITRTHKHTHTCARAHTHNHFTALWNLSGTTWMSRYQKNHSPLTPIMVINDPLSASSIYYDPWHPLCSIYMPDSFPQSLFKFSLVYL